MSPVLIILLIFFILAVVIVFVTLERKRKKRYEESKVAFLVCFSDYGDIGKNEKDWFLQDDISPYDSCLFYSWKKAMRFAKNKAKYKKKVYVFERWRGYKSPTYGGDEEIMDVMWRNDNESNMKFWIIRK